MGRADDIEKAERLNQARQLLEQFDHLPDAVDKMVRDCRVSPRQAYRYLQQARRLKQPVVVGDPKVAFTVKLSQRLVERVRSHAACQDFAERDCESSSGSAAGAEDEGVAERGTGRPCTIHLEYRFDRLLPGKLEQAYELLVPDRRRPIESMHPRLRRRI